MRERSTIEGSISTPVRFFRRTRGSCSDPENPEELLYTTYVGTRKTKTILDVQTPGYKVLLKNKGVFPMNPVNISTVTEEHVAGAVNIQSASNGTCYLARLYGQYHEDPYRSLAIPPLDNNILTATVNSALSRAMSPKWDIATCLAEIKSTHATIYMRAKSLMDYAETLAYLARKRNIPFERAWLEYRYGWIPIFLDAQNAIEAFGTKMQKGQRLKGTASQTESDTLTKTHVDYFGNSTRTTVEVLSYTRRYRGSALAEVTSPFNARFGGDPLVTGWELIPFSFVVDWFWQVGDYLEATRPLGGSQRLLGSTGSTRVTAVYTRTTHYSYHSGSVGTISGIRSRETIETYERVPQGASIPSWNPRLSQLRLADVGALLGRRLLKLANILKA